jgi:hypothetical protein
MLLGPSGPLSKGNGGSAGSAMDDPGNPTDSGRNRTFRVDSATNSGDFGPFAPIKATARSRLRAAFQVSLADRPNVALSTHSGRNGLPYAFGMATTSPSDRCSFCGHPGSHSAPEHPASGGARMCRDCDRCWADQQNAERPPHHG